MQRSFERSKQLFAAASKVIPGGVNSPVRAFRSVGMQPLFIKKAKGAYLFDEDGNKLIDYVGSWGPMILGHADDAVLEFLQQTMEHGLSFGAPSRLETELAEKVLSFYPSMDKVRMVNSGTEAVMGAVRLARGYSQKDKILKFIGCYHGHADYLLVKAGSGSATLGVPDSLGVPASFSEHTLLAEYNDLAAVKKIFQQEKNLAAVIIEPIAGNMGMVEPEEGFLQALRDLCSENNALLIFDEVMTGFRVAKHGCVGLYQVEPDIVVLGKVIGGGLPVGAYLAKSPIMDQLAPLGKVYQAGTLSGNPLAMAAGLATLEKLLAPDFYQRLQKKSTYLMEGLASLAKKHHRPIQTSAIGGMMGFYFHDRPVKSFADLAGLDTDLFARFFRKVLEGGVYLAPSAYEALFMSAAHQQQDLDSSLAVFDASLASLSS